MNILKGKAVGLYYKYNDTQNQNSQQRDMVPSQHDTFSMQYILKVL